MFIVPFRHIFARPHTALLSHDAPLFPVYI